MTWAKGKSGNPSGRPRGAAGLAKYVSEQTDGGRELVDRLLQLSRDTGTPVRERLAATSALLDRAVGKALQPSEIAMHLSGEISGAVLLAMPPVQRLAYLGQIRAQRALPEPQSDDSATDDNTPPELE